MALDIACQQYRIWTFPKQLRRKEVVFPTLAVVGVTASLILWDHSAADAFRGNRAFGSFNRAFSSDGTKTGIVAAPLVAYGFGLLRRDRYAQQTAIEAGEALLDAELVSKALKAITQRPGPGGFAPATNNNRRTWFSGQGGAFPSSHSATAFAGASVFAPLP